MGFGFNALLDARVVGLDKALLALGSRLGQTVVPILLG